MYHMPHRSHLQADVHNAKIIGLYTTGLSIGNVFQVDALYQASLNYVMLNGRYYLAEVSRHYTE